MNKDTYVPPQGPRFSQLYGGRGEPVQDSVRLRRRLLACVHENFSSHDVATALRRRLGVDVKGTSVPGGVYYHLPEFFTGGDWYDVLDAVSVVADIYKLSLDRTKMLKRATWIAFAKGAFIEENVAYRVDDEGVVHPLIDEEFVANLTSVIGVLSDTRLAAVRREAEAALADLDTVPPKTKHSIRAIFDAVESYVKLAFHSHKIARLDAAVVTGKVVPAIQKKLGSDAAANAAVGRMGAVLVDWTAAAHNYRHGPKATEPVDPPIEVATVLVSTGAALLRWLVQGTSDLLEVKSTKPPPRQ